jgi:trehalose 6-phosphate phosphatase
MNDVEQPPLRAPDELAAELGPADRLLLAVDFDGTLSPIVDRPDDAAPVDGAVEALAALAARTRVAIVSGRQLDDLWERLGDLPVAWIGGHGAQVQHADGRRDDLIDATVLGPWLDDAEEVVHSALDDTPGWLVERKRSSLAVHHRLAHPDSVDELLPRVEALLGDRAAGEPGGVVLHGKAVLELRPRGVDKGAALARVLAATPELVPVAIGDDTTDEDAFRCAQEHGGQGILVADTARPTAAAARLEDPTDVVALLRALAS